jgi:hypothetical protein
MGAPKSNKGGKGKGGPREFLCPTGPETDASQRTVCHECQAKKTSFRNLIYHYKRHHEFTAADMKGHWVYTEFLKEKRRAFHEKKDQGRAAPEITPLEKSLVALAYTNEGGVDETRFLCLQCEAGARAETFAHTLQGPFRASV